MLSRIINYGIKILIIVLGILILTGVILDDIDSQMRITFGVVFILFGIYRLSMYYTKETKYSSIDDNDEDEDEK